MTDRRSETTRRPIAPPRESQTRTSAPYPQWKIELFLPVPPTFTPVELRTPPARAVRPSGS